MTHANLGDVLRYLRRLTDPQAVRDVTDAELLERFCHQREEAAFTILLQRHGPMVLAACRRVLGDLHAAEDAFQATFLVLVRKADSIRKQASLASWLYGVALRVAARARSQGARRRSQERQFTLMPSREPSDMTTLPELRAVLDEELALLPEKYRAPLVLCYLEAKTQEQAARELHCPRTSLASRLVRARELLRERLARRGVSVPSGVVAVLLAREAAQAAVPAMLTITTVRAALVTAGGHVGAGFVSQEALALSEGTLKTMSVLKLKRGWRY
jgi:RNA polymerase sigma factor (sigma-70 family)